MIFPDNIFHNTPFIILILAFCIGYGLGSIPFGLIFTKLAGIQDLRNIGSGNIGATNVLRTGRKDLAAATLLLDALKGTLAVLIVDALGLPFASIIAGLGAFLGHLFPVWLEFKGGKGVATFLGVTFGLWWPAGLVFILIWASVAYFTRYSSLAALCASLAVVIAFITANKISAVILFIILSIFLWWKHWPNIQRLMTGTENKIGQ